MRGRRFGLLHPARDLFLGRKFAYKLFGVVDLAHFRVEMYALRPASSGTVSTPAASSSSEYSPPIL
jgi:hypothetical protein